jgi:hypothetical protein
VPTAAKKRTKPIFKADLNAEITTLPIRTLKSVADIFVHLENQALRQRRDCGSLWEDESLAKVQEMLSAHQPIEAGAFGGYRFRELGRQVLATARAQVSALQARTCEIQALILINGWKTAERLWLPLQAECKTPLYEVNFLEDLWGFDPGNLIVNGWSFGRHRRQFVLIQADIGILLARQHSLMELSNALERDLGCWLGQFAKILDKLDEESLP